MEDPSAFGEQNNLRLLRREWLGYGFGSAAFIIACFLVINRAWGYGNAWRWLGLSLPVTVYQFYYLHRHLLENRIADSDGKLLPSLGAANWITLIRATINAALAGFLLNPWPSGWLAWAPGILYLISVLMDFADGFVARVTGRMTLLGEALDMQWDGVGVLVASILAVLYGQAPFLYVLVGLARYLFLFGQWTRTRLGLPVFDLPPSRIRRAFAGTQMGFIAAVLMPVYHPPTTQVVAWIFMVPFLILFFRDWLFVAGVLHQPALRTSQEKYFLGEKAGRLVPWVSRGILGILLVELFIHNLKQRMPQPYILAMTLLAIPAIMLGAAGRIASLVALLMSGFALQADPFEWRFWTILLFGAITMIVGTGDYSLWKPEDWLIYKKAGERQPSAKTH